MVTPPCDKKIKLKREALLREGIILNIVEMNIAALPKSYNA